MKNLKSFSKFFENHVKKYLLGNEIVPGMKGIFARWKEDEELYDIDDDMGLIKKVYDMKNLTQDERNEISNYASHILKQYDLQNFDFQNVTHFVLFEDMFNIEFIRPYLNVYSDNFKMFFPSGFVLTPIEEQWKQSNLLKNTNNSTGILESINDEVLDVMDVDFPEKFMKYLQQNLSFYDFNIAMETTGKDYSEYHSLPVGTFYIYNMSAILFDVKIFIHDIKKVSNFQNLKLKIERIGDTTPQSDEIELSITVKGFDKNPIFHKLKGIKNIGVI